MRGKGSTPPLFVIFKKLRFFKKPGLSKDRSFHQKPGLSKDRSFHQKPGFLRAQKYLLVSAKTRVLFKSIFQIRVTRI